MKYTITWFAFFCLIPCSLLPLWKPLTDWALGNAVVKIPDLHFGNAVYLDISRNVYPLVYSYSGDRLFASLACIPILMADLLATLLFGSFLFHLAFKYILGGEGSFKDALAVITFGDLPSLLFGYLPYSAAVGLAWTSLLQIPVGFHYVYGIPWNRALMPYVMWTLFVFISWGTMGTASPRGFVDLIPRGPYPP